MAMLGGSGVAVGMGAGAAEGVGLGAGLRAACAAGEERITEASTATSDAANRKRFKILILTYGGEKMRTTRTLGEARLSRVRLGSGD